MEIIKTYSLYLNSRQATLGDSNNCTFILNPALTLTNISNRFIITAEMVEIPYSFNQINNNYNTLYYSFTDGTGTVNSNIVFPEGNYNVNQLITTFISLLITDITIYRPAINLTTSNFNIYYNPSTSKITFSIINKTLSITLNFSTNEILGICFGFPKTDQTFSNIIILNSINKVNVNPITSIYLRSENIKFSTSYEAVVQPYNISDIVAKIPVQTLPNSILYFRGDQKQMINNLELSSINLYWSDNLSPSYSLDLKGLNYGIYFTISEVQIKNNNSFLDKIDNKGVNVPNELYEEREKILLDLIKEKQKLENEINESKAKKTI